MNFLEAKFIMFLRCTSWQLAVNFEIFSAKFTFVIVIKSIMEDVWSVELAFKAVCHY